MRRGPREPSTSRYAHLLGCQILVVVTTPPLMLSVFGAMRIVLPLDEVATNSRIRPSVPVTIRLTVPIVAPPLPFTVRPVARPGRAPLGTEARASALLGLAREIAVKDACISDWFVAPRILVVPWAWSALRVFERAIPLEDALSMPWLFMRGLMLTRLGSPMLGPIAGPKPPLIPVGAPPP